MSSTLLIGNAAGNDNFSVATDAVSVGSTANSSTLAVYNTLTVTGNVNPQHNDNYDLGAYGTAWQDLFASGTVRAGALNITGATTFTGAIFGSSTLLIGDAAGDTELNIQNDAVEIGQSTNSTTLAVFGNTTVTGNVLSQTNDQYDLGSYTQSWNEVYASGTVRTNALEVGQGFGASGLSVSSAGVLQLDGAAFMSSTLLIGNAAGNDNFSVATDAVSVGSTANSSTLAVYNTLTVTGNVNPEHNDNYDLGGYGTAWQDLFASGTVRAGALNITGATTFTGAIFGSSTLLICNTAGSDDFFVADGASRFGNTNASSTLFVYGPVTTTGHLYPQHNNTYDLGAYGAAWRTLFPPPPALIPPP